MQAHLIHKAKVDTLCRKHSGYLKSAVENIRFCAFVRLAACQWRTGQSRLNPGESGVRQIEAMTDSPPTTWWLAGPTGRRIGKEAVANGLLYRFLTCGGLIDNTVKPPCNHPTG